MDMQARITAAQAKLKKAEQLEIATRTQKEAAEKQVAEITAEMATENVTPDTIQAEMNREELTALDCLDKVEKLIPEV